MHPSAQLPRQSTQVRPSFASMYSELFCASFELRVVLEQFLRPNSAPFQTDQHVRSADPVGAPFERESTNVDFAQFVDVSRHEAVIFRRAALPRRRAVRVED